MERVITRLEHLEFLLNGTGQSIILPFFSSNGTNSLIVHSSDSFAHKVSLIKLNRQAKAMRQLQTDVTHTYRLMTETLTAQDLKRSEVQPCKLAFSQTTRLIIDANSNRACAKSFSRL